MERVSRKGQISLLTAEPGSAPLTNSSCLAALHRRGPTLNKPVNYEITPVLHLYLRNFD